MPLYKVSLSLYAVLVTHSSIIAPNYLTFVTQLKVLLASNIIVTSQNLTSRTIEDVLIASYCTLITLHNVLVTLDNRFLALNKSVLISQHRAVQTLDDILTSHDVQLFSGNFVLSTLNLHLSACHRILLSCDNVLQLRRLSCFFVSRLCTLLLRLDERIFLLVCQAETDIGRPLFSEVAHNSPNILPCGLCCDTVGRIDLRHDDRSQGHSHEQQKNCVSKHVLNYCSTNGRYCISSNWNLYSVGRIPCRCIDTTRIRE